jgi:UDP-N-acetylglucosamine diphosphorylase / glucose-1-phosphate thymidylyltransferase / UDP-N-acetylgalactosamine diphosphorylase / glucosamine-1-phosphate N-acetyltransferase / galactosamine-1-phosphate N-acetyltransferase
MHIILYEDTSQPSLLPLTHVNPDFDLRCGVFTARERAARLFADATIALGVRTHLADVMRERSGAVVNEFAVEGSSPACLHLSGRALLDAAAARVLSSTTSDTGFLTGDGDLIAVACHSDSLRAAFGALLAAALSGAMPVDASLAQGVLVHADALAYATLEVPVLRHPWDAIAHNRRMLASDAGLFAMGMVDPTARISPHAIVCDPAAVHVGAGAVIAAGAIVDPVEGPVIIDEGAEIMHGAIVRGPVYVGRGSRIKAGAKVYEGTSIGPVCKVGGEVEDVIFHSYANKQHEGFAGHSYFAAWTNLGADTNTSDLKNNYSPVRMTIEGLEHDTGRMFLGSILADHTKTGINTMLNTGTTAGVGCNLYGGDFPPKYLPSFSWGGAAGLATYDLDRFVRTASAVMQRRGLTLTDAERALLAHVFASTAAQRAHHTPST